MRTFPGSVIWKIIFSFMFLEFLRADHVYEQRVGHGVRKHIKVKMMTTKKYNKKGNIKRTAKMKISVYCREHQK
jgi:hypothetical protein